MKRLISLLGILCFAWTLPAGAVPVTFTKLTGALVGGSPAGTAAYKADLSSLGLANILSISITDNSGVTGGAPGQFSGFDLDAIVLSTTDCVTHVCAAALSGIAAFNFGPAGTLFTAGTQRPTVDPKLFGTGAGGTTVDNSVANLGAFDGNSTTSTTTLPVADGFVSMGDGGVLGFNLTSAVSTSGLFLYIGEVGDNGEVAAGNIVVSDTRLVPEPGTLGLMLLSLAGVVGFGLRRRDRRGT